MAGTKQGGPQQKVEVSTSVAHSGKNSMKCSNHMPYGTDKIAQELTLKPGKKYKVVFWAKGDRLESASTDGMPCVVTIEYQEKDGKIKPIYIEPRIGNQWKLTAKIVKIPDDASEEGRICLKLFWASGTLWFDDVVVTPLQ